MVALSDWLMWLRDLGLLLVLLASVVTAIGALAKAPLVGGVLRWLWRHNVANPIERVARRVLDEQLDPIRRELAFNGGATVKDAVHRMEATLTDGFAEARAARAVIVERIDRLEKVRP